MTVQFPAHPAGPVETNRHADEVEAAMGGVPEQVAAYDPAANGYDLSLDPRCLWGWGDCGHMHGHACFRPYRHTGRCWDSGHRPTSGEDACYTSRRPVGWDEHGRARANA